MRKQRGFGAVQMVLVIVVVGIIGFTGWFVWQNQNQTNEILNQSNSADFVATSGQPQVHLDKNLVASGWTVDSSAPKMIVLSNANGEEMIANNCFVQATVDSYSTLRISKNVSEDLIAEKEHAAVKDAKGYEYSLTTRTPILITVNGQKRQINGYEGKYFNGDSVLYRVSGYILSNHTYVDIVASCNTSDLTEAASLFKAISVTM